MHEHPNTLYTRTAQLLYGRSSQSTISRNFKVSSRHFKFLYEKDLNKLNDFRLIVNGKSFGINFSLFCCVSDKFQEMNCEEELSLTIPS
jgi:hypothetical protein